MTLISVIIPTYRDTERLGKCIQALGNQTLDKAFFEVIVVNNYPNEILNLASEHLDNLKLRVVTEEKPGSYAARNRGIEEATGEILAFTDSDCIPDLRWLNSAREIFKQDINRQLGVLTGPIQLFFKDPVSLTLAEIYEKYTAFPTEAYAREGFAVTANWFSYKSVVDKFGRFDDRLKSNGDSDLSWRISGKYEILYSRSVVVDHPARCETSELVRKYQRRLGGTYTRLYLGKKLKFGVYVLQFIFRRYRFALKKFFTVSPKESFAIFIACNVINFAVLREYFLLVNGRETKR